MDERHEISRDAATPATTQALIKAGRQDVLKELARARLDVAFIDRLVAEAGATHARRPLLAVIRRIDDLIAGVFCAPDTGPVPYDTLLAAGFTVVVIVPNQVKNLGHIDRRAVGTPWRRPNASPDPAKSLLIPR
jgi:hypothetical protein